MTNGVTIGIIAHHSPEGSVLPEHFNYSNEDLRYNCIDVKSESDIMDYSIKHFSPQYGSILAMTIAPGKLHVHYHIGIESTVV